MQKLVEICPKISIFNLVYLTATRESCLNFIGVHFYVTPNLPMIDFCWMSSSLVSIWQSYWQQSRPILFYGSQCRLWCEYYCECCCDSLSSVGGSSYMKETRPFNDRVYRERMVRELVQVIYRKIAVLISFSDLISLHLVSLLVNSMILWCFCIWSYMFVIWCKIDMLIHWLYAAAYFRHIWWDCLQQPRKIVDFLNPDLSGLSWKIAMKWMLCVMLLWFRFNYILLTVVVSF